MGRPFVQVQTENRGGHLLQRVQAILPELEALPGIVGIMLSGGLSRGYADLLSEIDLTLYLEPADYQAWHRQKTPVALGITRMHGDLYDIKIADIVQEQQRCWQAVELWDLSYARLLYDPEGKLTLLRDTKLSPGPSVEDVEGLLFQSWWYFRLAGDIWLQRNDPLQGHLMMNLALIPLIQALFLANNEYVPHEKWLIHMSRSLTWQPAPWENRLQQAMRTGDVSPGSLSARQAVIEELWTDVEQHIIATSFPQFPLHIMQKTVYDLLMLLAKQESLTLQEWQEKAPLALLNSEPFHLLIRIERETLFLLREKVLQTRPEELYAWHYEIVAAMQHVLAS